MTPMRDSNPSSEDAKASQAGQQATDALSNVKILEFSAIGPVPWGVNLFVDMGAEVTRICRPPASLTTTRTAKSSDAISEHGRYDVYIDLKTEAGRKQALGLIESHDALIEGMRPGAMERLGLSPADCRTHNPRLVYARVTGWGQKGPLASRAGHDINYIALSGALHAIGPRKGPPVVPLNLIGDYGGGGAFVAIGVLAALFKAKATGEGSVVDIAMLDGAAQQMSSAYERLSRGEWSDERGVNTLDGGAPWYSVYQAQCGNYMAVGAIEPQFYKQFLLGLELDETTLPDRSDRSQWNALHDLFADRFKTRTRQQWTQIFDALDACVSPVLSLSEAPQHPHNRARLVFVTSASGAPKPGLAPRFWPLATS